MNCCVFLARWLCHHLHTRIQNLFARHHQLGITTAKQDREQFAEMMVNLVEGVLQQVTCFLVDLADRVLQRRDRFDQVSILRIKEILALRSLRQFIQRCKVDRTQGRNHVGQASNFALQV